jgi:hypothetical protein
MGVGMRSTLGDVLASRGAIGKYSRAGTETMPGNLLARVLSNDMHILS